jgi:hypothetical protein
MKLRDRLMSWLGYKYIANFNTKEIHVNGKCHALKNMSQRNKIYVRNALVYLAMGYNGCRFCLKRFDTG